MKRKRFQEKGDRPKEWKGSVEVQWVRYRNMALRQVKLSCGKPTCTKCPHGPYWYLVIWRGTRPRQWYVGRHLLGMRLRRFPDRETLVLKVIEGAGFFVPRDEIEYLPEDLDRRFLDHEGWEVVK